MRRLALLMPLLLGACATAPSAPPRAYEAIAFDISSWGRPIDSWEVRADGTASHVKMVQDEGAPFRTYRLEHREFAVPPADFARLAGMAAALPRPRLDRADCKQRATDLPYGKLRLTQAGSAEDIAFDVGCLDAPYRAFVGQLRAMDAEVTKWAEAHAPARVEAVDGD